MPTTEERIRAVFAKVFGVDPNVLQRDSSPTTIGNWDSLRNMQLVLGLENEFDISLSNEDLSVMNSFGDAVDRISSKL